MIKDILADSTSTLDQVMIKRRVIEQERNPDVDMQDSIILKNGPRAFKVATFWRIVDRHTGELHHHALKIETFNKRKIGWEYDADHSVTLDDDRGDEILQLERFLGAVCHASIPDAPGDYIVMPVDGDSVSVASVRQVLNTIAASGKVDLIAEFLSMAKGNAEVLQSLVRRAMDDPEASREAAAALNLARYTSELGALERLIATEAREGTFQSLLAKNPWIFGSEYSELLDRRIWTRDETQDFMLRRTADGYLEIIEIKTPLEGRSLFLADTSHNTLYPRSELSVVIGQVLHYLEEIDAARFSIKAKDGEDVSKIRAKVIIGRDGDAEQAAALRRLNGHLHRIEVLTFDQLLRIGRQVVTALNGILSLNEG